MQQAKVDNATNNKRRCANGPVEYCLKKPSLYVKNNCEDIATFTQDNFVVWR